MLEVPFTSIQVPKLKEDLIRTSCSPSNNLKLISEYIGDFSTRDPLLNWINQNIIK
jgi:hypothetical protein